MGCTQNHTQPHRLVQPTVTSGFAASVVIDPMKPKNKQNTIIFIAACAVLAGATAIFSSKPAAPPEKSSPGTPAVAKPALTVTTTQAQPSSLPIALTANGTVAAWQEASIGGESPGLRLAEVLVNVGDVVRRDQLLARFADDSVQADVTQARSSVAEASAMALEATANADRVRTLQSTGTFSGQQINQYLTAEQTAKARVESAKAALSAQLVRLKNTRLLAPDSGVISARSATVGAVPGNNTELFRLIRQGRLEWRAEVTATELGRMVAGTRVRVTTSGGADVPGRVRMVAPTVDPQTRMGLVYVDVPPMSSGNAAAQFSAGPPQGKLAPSGGSAVREATSVGASILPGMFAKGEFEIGSSSALTVPQQAVVVRDGFSYVFQLSSDQRVSQRKVQTGRRVGERVEVLQGLAPDALLAANGAGFLNDGDLVKVVTDPGQNSDQKSPIPQNQPAQAAIK
jgi:RND family efflux transporter MFP subunit